ncbi:MAG: DNA gyrase inhibitor YacG [Candidatus Magnetobacterium sp. LHC-1]|uniref:DNA gyrase inhibitor YacG n=1 Tax=Candidatus Magnetobacterium casense TaxID=1455061 RepID=A0ABS6RX89_9BACT|nr:DNA gyrase inhibitor YacG [Candidatus Magnetobacterium casensis]MBV6341252.1 DNA gyrase inhibitor YacG [Candidatus Magnetobacterium casensis]
MDVKCPTCGKQEKWEGNPHRPFCSKRCRLLDLASWVDESYRIPGKPVNNRDETSDSED